MTNEDIKRLASNEALLARAQLYALHEILRFVRRVEFDEGGTLDHAARLLKSDPISGELSDLAEIARLLRGCGSGFPGGYDVATREDIETTNTWFRAAEADKEAGDGS